MNTEYGTRQNEFAVRTEEAARDVCNMFRKLAILRDESDGIQPGALSTEQQQVIQSAYDSAFDFFNRFYPGYFDQKYSSNINYLKSLGEYAQEKEVPDYSFAGSGASLWEANHYRIRQKSCHGFIDDIMDEFDPADDKEGKLEVSRQITPMISNQDIFKLFHAPENFPGIRFLPVYRALEWNPEATGEKVIVHLPQNSHDDGRIDFENQYGRQFFIASAGNTYQLEHLINHKPVVVAVSGQPSSARTEFGIFDIDGTLDKDDMSEGDIEMRRQVLTAFADRKIPVGLWSRSLKGRVEWFADKFNSETGIRIFPQISFDHWPFSNCRVIDIKYNFDPVIERKIWSIRKIAERVSDCGFTELPWSATELHTILNQAFTNGCIDELKAPLLIALWEKNLSEKARMSLFHQGTLINNDSQSLESALSLGYNFIHVPLFNTLSGVIRHLEL
jgi:hypothetical protein